MNFSDTLQSIELVLAAREVPLLVGETGIGKTTLARELARKNDWTLVTIDGNLLKEGEIGGLPTVETYRKKGADGTVSAEKATVYAVHHTLRLLDKEREAGNTVLLFIDEINRCEHAVQQELMNLILNREINGYVLHDDVKIVAAMNPAQTYDYQTVEMDAAQENRFVWLYMEPDYLQWLNWASQAGIADKVMEFISTYPEYLCRKNEDDINATPRSYERISGLYRLYTEHRGTISKAVFYNVIQGNVGKVIAEEFVHFIENDSTPLISYDDVFTPSLFSRELAERIEKESHTRLYLTAKNILRRLENVLAVHQEDRTEKLDRLVAFLQAYPVDLMIGVMKDMRSNAPAVYAAALDHDAFINAYFAAYKKIR